MKIWYDTEFIEDGKTIELISIGMVREDGETLYLESLECDLSKANQWVQQNVIPHLTGQKTPRYIIRENILRFASKNPQFWAYFADYDWVVLCQLFGTMMDLPQHWPMFCMDVQQVRVEKGIPKLPRHKGIAHNALDDAKWAKEAHLWMMNLQD